MTQLNINKPNFTSVTNLDLPKYKMPKSPSEVDKAINAFFKGDVGKFGKYYAVKNALVYRTVITSNYGQEVETAQNIIALKVTKNNKTILIGNSSVLPLIGRTTSWGRESNNRSLTEVQQKISQYIQMIPFTVFTEANLNLKNINILERGIEETLVRKIHNPKYDSYDAKEKGEKYNIPKFLDETIHFTGSSLFEVDGNTFLFDIDRIEIEHKIFNPFLVTLNTKVNTIKEAYESLKPNEVKLAESSNLDVKRQGEWFFIPTEKEFHNELGSVIGNEKTKLEELEDSWRVKHYELRAGDNRPNKAQMGLTIKTKDGNEEYYVKGWVVHSGREHQPLELKKWHKCVPNTSTKSFTITGEID